MVRSSRVAWSRSLPPLPSRTGVWRARRATSASARSQTLRTMPSFVRLGGGGRRGAVWRREVTPPLSSRLARLLDEGFGCTLPVASLGREPARAPRLVDLLKATRVVGEAVDGDPPLGRCRRVRFEPAVAVRPFCLAYGIEPRMTRASRQGEQPWLRRRPTEPCSGGRAAS